LVRAVWREVGEFAVVGCALICVIMRVGVCVWCVSVCVCVNTAIGSSFSKF